MTGGYLYILIQELTGRVDNLPKAFIPQGSIAFENLPEQASSDKLGYIWNITNDFTTDSRFIEGAGKQYPAGNNVAVIKHDNNYYYDVMSAVDLSNYYTKVEVNNLISTEKTERETADTTLQSHINTEASTRESADNTLTTNLNNEVTRATNAESTLTTNLNTEISTRQTSDSTLQNSIDTEKVSREAADTALDERLKKFELPAEPEVKVIDNNNYLFANGVSIRIEDNTTENIAYYCTADGVQKSITFPYQSIVHGGGLGTASLTADVNSTLVIINGGKVKSIYGGSRDYGNVGVATVIVNGGTLKEGVQGGGGAAKSDMVNSVGIANITFNGGTSLATYGGGMGLATVGKVNMIVNGGTHQWVTAGGSNGLTGSATVAINGGTITCLQAVNRGTIQDVTMTINGGTITNIYGGGETGDSSVNGKCEKTILHINKSFSGQLNKGTYGGVEDASRVSGDYVESTITTAEATACNLTVITEKQDKLVSGTNIKTINSSSLLGSGDIEVKTFQPFPSDIKTGENGESLSDFISSIEDSSGAKEGMAYLGSIYNDVLPWTGGGNAECKIEYMCDWIALVTVSSSNIEPYYWTMNTNEGVWRGVQGKLTAGTNITIDENNVISATGSGSSYTAEVPIEITNNTIKHKEYFTKDSYAFGIVYYDKYGHITTINGQEVTGGLLHQANKITVNAGRGLEVDSDSNELKAVGVEYTNGLTTQENALKFVKLTQVQYDALITKDADTLYMIVG